MKASDIIRQVRLCIDEESNCTSFISDQMDDAYMDNIITDRIADAVRWVSVNAPASSFIFGGNATGDSGIVRNVSSRESSENGKLYYSKSWDTTYNIGCISFPDGAPARMLRVRGDSWHKAITLPFEEDSDEALMMYNTTAAATDDNPMAVIVRGNPTRLLVQPASDSFEASFVFPLSVTSGNDGEYSIPSTLQGAVIYYIAFLLLSAYDDSRAPQMYTIALQQLGVNQSQTQ